MCIFLSSCRRFGDADDQYIYSTRLPTPLLASAGRKLAKSRPDFLLLLSPLVGSPYFLANSSYFLVGRIVVFLITSYHKSFKRAPASRKSASLLTFFLLCGRKNYRIPVSFLPSKICLVGSSQL